MINKKELERIRKVTFVPSAPGDAWCVDMEALEKLLEMAELLLEAKKVLEWYADEDNNIIVAEEDGSEYWTASKARLFLKKLERMGNDK